MKRVMLLLLAALAAGCGAKDADRGKGEAPAVVSGVTVKTVDSATVPEELEVLGTVRAKNGAAIAARITGIVKAVRVKSGDRVSRGQLLLELEATENSAAAAAADAALAEARQGLEEARSRREMARLTYGRYEKLFQEQAVTRQEFDVRRTEQAVADQGFLGAEARLARAKEEARAATAVAGHARIVSPLSGVVTARPAEPGMTVFPGTVLVTVEEGGEYRLEANAPESLLHTIKMGDTVRVALEGAPAMVTGRVVESAPSVDPSSRTFPVKVSLSGPGITSGAYGRAWFAIGSRSGIMVPGSAVFERGALTAVWVVSPDKTARMRLVKVGRSFGDRVEVLAGLSAGEQVVVAGGEKVTDGAKLQ
jgi:RND family efflux transporter MFP subunit